MTDPYVICPRRDFALALKTAKLMKQAPKAVTEHMNLVKDLLKTQSQKDAV